MHGPAVTKPETPATRRIARIASRRPSRRAVVGGLLVAVAAIIAWTTIDAADRRPGRSIVVATRAIAPGERIDANAVTVRSVSIDEALARQEFSSISQLVDAVALGPIAEGDAIARSTVLPDPTGQSLRQFSFPVDRERSLNGDLRAGERVDVMATFGSGSDATTTIIARNALVLRSAEQKSGVLGSSSKLILTIGLASADQVLDAVHASQVADLTVVRSTLTTDSTAGRSSTSGPSTRPSAARS